MAVDGEFLLLGVVEDHGVANVKDDFLGVAGLDFGAEFEEFGAEGVERVWVAWAEGPNFEGVGLSAERLEFFDRGKGHAGALGGAEQFQL